MGKGLGNRHRQTIGREVYRCRRISLVEADKWIIKILLVE
jgi:hypothetical protein